MIDTDKQALIDGSATIPYRITILGSTENDNIVLNERDIETTEYQDYRYVDTATICVGQFVARTISGTLTHIDKNLEIENKEIKVEIGVKTSEGVNYYSLGNFLVTKPSNNDVKEKTSFNAMDYTKKFNLEFDDSDLTYPCTALQLAQYCCKKCGVELGTLDFINSNFIIENNQYETGDSYRRVMQDIGKIAYSWVRIGWDNKCYIDFEVPTKVENFNIITADNYYEDLSLQNKKFGPVNSVVIGMSNIEGENLSIEDKDSIAENGLCELQIMDNNLTYTPELREKVINGAKRLFGLEYVPTTVTTTGHPWLVGNELVEFVKIDGNTLKTIPFNRTISYMGHIKTKIESKAETQVNTEYKNTNTLENNVKKTRYIVDKQEQKITQLIQNDDEYNKRLTQITASVEGIEQSVGEIADLTRKVIGKNKVVLENAYEGNILGLKIHGNIVPLFPDKNQYPNFNLYSKQSKHYLTIEYEKDSEKRSEKILLPFNILLQKGNVYDEFIIDGDGNCYINKKLSITENYDIIELEKNEIIDCGKLSIPIHNGNNTISFSYYNVDMEVVYAKNTNITDLFATKVELNSSIRQTKIEINLEVSRKVDNDKVVSSINLSPETVKITGNRFVVESDNLSISENGILTAKGVELSGSLKTYDNITKNLALHINRRQIDLYDWKQQKLLSGSVGAMEDSATESPGTGIWLENGDFITIGYNNGSHISNFILCEKNSNDPPWIKNVASGGVIFPEAGGIHVKNGFITDWNLSTVSGTISVGGIKIYVKNGLITNWT